MCVQQEIVEELILLVHPTLVTADREQSDEGCNVEALVFGLSFEVLQVVLQPVDLIEQMLHTLEQCRELFRCSPILTDRHHHLLLLLTEGPRAAPRRLYRLL